MTLFIHTKYWQNRTLARLSCLCHSWRYNSCSLKATLIYQYNSCSLKATLIYQYNSCSLKATLIQRSTFVHWYVSVQSANNFMVSDNETSKVISCFVDVSDLRILWILYIDACIQAKSRFSRHNLITGSLLAKNICKIRLEQFISSQC